MTGRLRLLTLAVLLLACLGLASRVRLTTDLAAALPEEGEVAQAFADVQRFALLDTLLFDVDGEGRPPEELGAAIDALGQALEASGQFTSVRYRYTLEDGVRMRTAAGPHLALLTPPDVLAERLSPEGMTAALERARARLLGPAGALTARTLPLDPLDLGGSFTTGMMALGAGGSTILREGHVLSADGTHGLIVARTATPALGTTTESPLYVAVQEALAKSPLPVGWVGPHRFAAEAAGQIHHEVNVAVSLDLVLMVLVFLVAFRSVRPLGGTVPALVLAGAGAAAMAGLRSPLHAIALAFGGALAGMGVDYWIHLYLTGVREGVAPTFRERVTQGEHALRELIPAYAISVAATVAAFAMLGTSSYRAVADLGAIGIGTALGALASVVIGGPLVYAALARPGDRVPRPPLPERVNPELAVILAGAFVVLGGIATGVRFDGDPRAMDARLPETAALEQAIQARFTGEGTSALLVADGLGLDAALDELADGEAVLGELSGLTLTSPLRLLPAPAARAQVAGMMEDLPAIEARFGAAAEAAGFEPAPLVGGLRGTLLAMRLPRPEDWAGTPGEELLARTVRVADDGSASVATVITAASEDALRHAAHELELAGVRARLVQPAAVAAEGAERVKHELWTRSGLALLGVIGFMALRYRDPVRVLAASTPSLCAAAGTLGVCALLDAPLTPASGPALVLVLGVAFDQGLFLVEADRVSRGAFLASRAAILIALATAFAGFAGLLVATHPAVHSIGLVVSVGIACTFVGAFGIVPAMLTVDGGAWTSTLVRRGLLVTVLAVELDALVSMFGWVTPPEATGGPVAVDRDTPLDRQAGPNRLVRRHGLWVMHVEGDAYTIGRATAALAGDLPARNEAAMEEEFRRHVHNPLAQYLLVRGTPLFARAMAAHVPAPYLEELRGYVDGAPDPLGWIAPAFTRKLCYHAIHDVGQAMVDSPLLACTGFAAGGERTADGHWLLARNFDFDGGRVFDEDKAVTYVQREGAIPFVHVAIVGLGGAVSGVNAEGIAVALLAGASDAPIRVGDPMIFALREVLEQARSLDDVQRILDQRRGFVSEGVLAVDGDAGEAAVFEVTSADVTRLPAGAEPDRTARSSAAFERATSFASGDGGGRVGALGRPGADDNGASDAEKGRDETGASARIGDPKLGTAIALSNHFRGAAHRGDAANNLRMIEGTSVARLRRMEELVAVDRGPIDLSRAIAILRDRRGAGDAPLPAGHEAAINADIASHGVVLDATARTLTVSTFPNLAGPFVRFSLADLAAGNLDGEVVAGPDEPSRTWAARHARELVDAAQHQDALAAEVTLRRALRVNPGDLDATLSLGFLLHREGRDAEARPLLEAALATPPERVGQARDARAALGLLEGAP